MIRKGVNHGMYKHGEARNGKRTKEWRTWNGMIRRVKYPSMESYPRYGGRGITVCKRWLGINGFINFLADMRRAPSTHHSLDRINNDGNYTPKNCRWATRSQQIRNSTKARLITFNEQTKHIGDWSNEIGINRQTIQMRIDVYKWPVEKALTVKP